MLKSRHSLIAAIMIVYFIPLFVMGSYSLRWLTFEQSWNMISLSVMLAVCGSLVIFGFLYFWEQEKPETLPAVIEIPQVTNDAMQAAFDLQELDLKNAKEELDRFKRLWDDLDNEKVLFKESLEQQVLEKNQRLAEQEQIISELKQLKEANELKCEELETKVQDLSYEIKTLLQLSELQESLKDDPFETLEPVSHSAVPKHQELSAAPIKLVRSADEAFDQLKRCLDIAQKITGLNHYQHMDSRYQSLPVQNIALDQRHLFDNLRSEQGAAIVFYSHKENKLLFANQQIKNLLGWSPEKVMEEFSELTVEGIDDWKKGTHSKNNEPISLMMRAKSGEILEVKALLGMINSGVFRQDSIAVLYNK